MYRFVTVAVFVVLLNPLVLGAEVDGSPDIQLVPEQNRFAPGDVGRFTFSIVNNGDISTAGPQRLEEQVMSAEGLTYTVGGENNASANIRRNIFAVGTVPDGLFPKKMGFRIAVDEDTSPGNYTVPVNLSYRYKDSIDYNVSTGAVRSYDYDDSFVEKDLILRIDDTAELELVDSSFSGSVGDSGTLKMEVRNVGGSVDDASFSLSSRNPDLSFGRSSSSERYVGDWEEGETESFSFRASVSRNALESEMTVQASASFSNDGFSGSDSFSFGLDVAEENKISLEDVDATLRKGSSESITGKVVNDEGRSLEDVELVFSPRDPYLTVKQSSYAVGTLEAGEEANFSFPVEVSGDAEPGPRLYSLDASYRTAGGDTKALTSVNFGSEITDSEGDFTVDAVNSSVRAGSSGRLVVEVTNPSGEVYRNLDAKIFTSDPVSSSDDTAFVSELGPGESENLTFRVASSGSALKKSYPVSLDFRYEVDGESEMSETYTVPVQVMEAEEGSLPVVPIVAVVLVGLLGLSYYFRRPEKIWERFSGE